MSAPTTYNLDRLYRLLGVKGGRRPEIRTDFILPVAQVANVAPLAEEIFEARGVFGVSLIAAVGQRGFLEIQARDGGGVLVEQMHLHNRSAVGGIDLKMERGTVSLALANDIQVEQIGDKDEPLRTTVTAENKVAAAVGGATIPMGAAEQELLPDMRIWIPPGRFLQVSTSNTNKAFDCVGVLRGLSSQGGA